MGHLAGAIGRRRRTTSVRSVRPRASRLRGFSDFGTLSPITGQNVPVGGDWGTWCDQMWPPGVDPSTNVKCRATPAGNPAELVTNWGIAFAPWTQAGAGARGLSWPSQDTSVVNTVSALVGFGGDPLGLLRPHTNSGAVVNTLQTGNPNMTPAQAIAAQAQANPVGALLSGIPEPVVVIGGAAALGLLGYLLLG